MRSHRRSFGKKYRKLTTKLLEAEENDENNVFIPNHAMFFTFTTSSGIYFHCNDF